MTTTAPAPAQPKTLRTVLLVVGSVVLVAIIGYLIIAVAATANRSDASREVEFSESFDAVSVDVGVADVVVEYDDVSEATVAFRQNDARRSYQFDAELDGSTLEVRVVDRWSGFWLPFGNQSAPVVTITLPESLEELDIEVESGVGDVRLEGAFGEVDLGSGVGDLRLEGSADVADIESSVGDITARDFSVSGDLTVSSSTGDVTLALDEVPASLTVTSKVGDQTISLPKGDYRVETETGVGDLNLAIDNDSDADTLLRFESSVGDITVRN